MKKVIPVLLVISLILSTCKENEPTAPEEEAPTEILSAAEITIGPEGGTLEIEDLKVIIPNGAFATSTELKLYVEPKEDPFGEFSVSKQFRITGIPNDYQFPIQVSLKYTGTLGESNYIAFGFKDTINISDTSFVDIKYNLADAEIANGYLVGNIPIYQTAAPGLNKINIDDEILEFFIGAMTQKEKWNPFGDHFEVKGVVSASEQDMVDEFVSNFEQAYERFKNAEFIYTDIKWPIRINFIKDPDYGFPSITTVSYLDENSGIRIVYKESLNISDFTKGSIHSSFLDKILYTYNFTTKKSKTLRHNLRNWASFKYSYGIFPEFFVKKAINAEMNKFTSNYQSFLIDYLARRYGESILSKICRDILFIDDPIKVIFNNTEKPENWLSGYYQNLMTNTNYSSKLPNDFWINTSHKTYIDNETKKIELVGEYNDLGVQFIHISLSKDLKEKTALHFTTSDANANISIIKYIGNNYELIDHSQAKFTVIDAQKYVEDGYDLFVIVTNNNYKIPYNNKTNITLTIENTNRPTVTDCSIHLRNLEVNQLVHYESGDQTISGFIDWHIWTHDETIKTFENNIFYQNYSYSENHDSTKYSGTMRVEFSEDLDTILTFSVTEKYSHIDADSVRNISDELSFSGYDLPLIPSFENNLYEVTGLDVCKHLNNNMEYSRSSVSFVNWDLIDIKQCVAQSNLYIQIEKE